MSEPSTVWVLLTGEMDIHLLSTMDILIPARNFLRIFRAAKVFISSFKKRQHLDSAFTRELTHSTSRCFFWWFVVRIKTVTFHLCSPPNISYFWSPRSYVLSFDSYPLVNSH